MKRFDVLALSLVLCCFCARAGDPPVTYVRAGKLLDVRAGKLLTDQVIVIRGEKIERVAGAAQVQIPAGATVVDLSRATVLPGLIDAHTHIFLTGEDNGRYDEQLLKESWQYRTIEAVVNAKRDLDAGFTSMRDLETEGAMYSDVDVRNAINRGLIPGPRLQVVTRAISTTGGYPLEGYSPEVRCRQACRSRIAGRGAQGRARTNQIWRGPDQDLRHAQISFHAGRQNGQHPDVHARRSPSDHGRSAPRRRKVACHAYGGAGLQNCLDGGVDSIEHGLDLDDAAVAEMVAKEYGWCRRSMFTKARRARKTTRRAAEKSAARACTSRASGKRWRRA